ncbi:bacterial regulatory, luxR family protein [Rhodococcus sp. MTM3W5.2]|uniref:AAA family ATPase n=1 Tax=Rhodococcus sp. MTM3W5.2 TaxID=1805827 RepID=UPI0009796831|nr:LuxR family transcriptional regulator [Rhodococcus sp. MTM3W5.2]AQA21087.1 bacterial regulatory, luxR family protein [Rhodococcus sp. MTM3W5.2]
MMSPTSDGRSPLFGREHEIAALTAFLTNEHPEAGAMTLFGEAGLGKSALLDEAAGIAADHRYRVIRAAGIEAESDMGFAALTTIIRAVRRRARNLDPRHAAALEAAMGVPLPDPIGLHALGDAVLAGLESAAGAAKLLLLVDDLSALDPSSAAVLGYVARRLADTNARLIGASRTDEAPLFDQPGIDTLRVHPLPRATAETLLVTRFPQLPRRVRQRVLDQAEGNPLALLELPAAIRDDNGHGLSGDALPLTPRLQSVFARRLDALSPTAREMLLLCALEPHLSPATLQRIAHVDDALMDLAPAEALDLIEIDAGFLSIGFRHPLIRAAVVGSSTASDRRLAHLKLADAAEHESSAQAWHLAHAAIGPDELVAARLERASGISARRGDVHGAVAAMIRAADLSEDQANRGRRMAAAAYLSASLLGDLDDVPRMLVSQPSSDEPLVAAIAASYHLLSAAGHIDIAHRLLVTAIEMTDEEFTGTNGTLLEAFYTLIRICHFGGKAHLWDDFDVHLARMTDPPLELRLQALTLRDPVRTAAEAAGTLDNAIEGLPRSHDPLYITRVCLSAGYTDRLPACRPALTRVVDAARAGGALPPALDAVFQLGIDAFLTGSWDEADLFIEDGLRWSHRNGFRLLDSPGNWIRACIAAARGDYDTATQLAARIRRWATPRGAHAFVRYALHADTLCALSNGDYDLAFTYASAIDKPGELARNVPHALWNVLDLVEAAARTGRHTEARAHVRAAVDAHIADISPRMTLLVTAAQALARIGDPLVHYRAALQTEDADIWAFETARVRLLYGRELHRTGRITESRSEIHKAMNRFADMRAEPWVAKARRELARTGLRDPQQERPEASDTLTPQQTVIADLAASGLTNKEIGEQLHLSPRTVSTHLYQIFPKLNITTRAALRDALSTRSGSETSTGEENP